MAQVCFTASIVGFLCCLSVLNACKWDPDTELEQGLDISSFDNGAAYLADLPEISDAEQCQNACCERDDCQLAVIGTPADGRPECRLVSCMKDGKDVCVLTQSTQFKVYRKILDSADQKTQNAAEVRSVNTTDVEPLPEMTSDEFQEKCLAPAQTGLCKASIRRYYYNNGTCQLFIYGGCGGNQNNYKTEESCMTTCTGTLVCDSSAALKVKCQKKITSRISVRFYIKTCAMPSDSGPCRAAFPVFYFEPNTQSCKPFIYGGCQGNLNRYSSEEECMAACSGKDGYERNRWTPAFFLVATLAIMSALLLVGLILIAMRRNAHWRSFILDDKEELLPAEEQVSYEKQLPKVESS
uniref:Kunitz-type serine protease inhibitor 6-like n=1 Tax=Sinocyclocheilus rhinocerous TaxID=307959 RepID=A0A673IMD4_9TELE